MFNVLEIYSPPNLMKEMNDKDESLVICNNEVSFLPPDEDPGNNAEEKESGEIVEREVQDCESESFIDDKSSLSKDLIKVEEDVNEVNESEADVQESNDDVTKEDNVDKKLVLRPRKTDSLKEGSKTEKSGSRKTEKKCAINKNDDLTETDILMVTETETKLEPIEETLDVDEELVTEVKEEDFGEDPILPSQNEGMMIIDTESLVKSEDSSKSKDNSESDTRISTASENSITKVPKKKRRRREAWWTKKRKRSEGHHVKEDNGLNIPVRYEWREPGSSSPSSNENGKRKCSDGGEVAHKKSREFAIPSPSLADISMKPAIPESTATSIEMSRTMLCLCRKKPQVFISGNNNAGDLYCQALDCIDNRIVGCCNPIPSKDVALFRASERASYQMMCNIHQQRLFRHNCCPSCGLFCTQGKYLMCKSLHHFHKLCSLQNEMDMIVCPHCGDDNPPKAVIVSIHSQKDPVFLPHQKPIRNMKSAKMSITRGAAQFIEDDDPTFEFPACLFNGDGDDLSPANGLHGGRNLHRDKYGYKSLYNAAVSGDAEKLLKIIACGLNPNHIFEDGNKQTALHLAAANGHLSVVHILLQAKAQINVLDAEQNTPLTAAINAKRNDVVKYLIKSGADLILKSEDGMTPLHIAAKCGNVGACFHLLNGSHLPPRYIDSLDDGGWTPMVWASEFNHIEVVKFLISKGADPLIKDAEQNIALHWAAFGGSLDIVELYLNDGSDINAVNVHGDTPLHIAARQDKYSCVLLLLARGARSDIKNKSGELPRDCSESPASEIYKGITLNMEISALLTRFQDRTPRIICNDISKGKERNQIQCVNAVDDEGEPRDYVYVSESCFTSKISVDRTINSLQSCKCRDSCGTENCNCATVSIKCWYDNEGRLRPDFNYADPPMIFECNQACQCNRITCRNRVVQNGLSCRFQLFRTEANGWGIKTLNLIPKGTYVCEYIGEIISDCEADHRENDSYLFDLDNRDGETYCIDARHYGNFARFINHMCVPNVMPVHVFVDHQDLRFPRIAFFANRDILPEEEIGYNYGEKFWVIKCKSFTCTCGSDRCMYSENTIQTTLDNYRKKLSVENPTDV